MSEIATRTEQPADVAVPVGPSHALVHWAEGARAAHTIAQSLAGTPFVPESFKGSVALVTAAILVGQEVGLQPMAALRSIDIVQGTPALRAVALRALAQSHGHEMWTVEQTTTRVVMSGRRFGTDKVLTVEWTMDRAKALGVAGRPNYQKQPMTMLIARATSELARLIAADVLLGIPYSAEELADGADIDPPPAAAPEAKRRTARRAPLAPVRHHEEPTLDEPPAAPVVEQPQMDEPDWPEVTPPAGAEEAS